jgi:hypothetical protein
MAEDRLISGCRTHIKEGMVMVEEDRGIFYNLRVPRTAVQLLYGRQVKADDMLIIAQVHMTLDQTLPSSR